MAMSLRSLTDARFRETFDLSNFHGGRIQASIETKNDAFPIDDTASALVPPQRKIRTVLVTPGNEYLETLLKLDRSVELEQCFEILIAGCDEYNRKSTRLNSSHGYISYAVFCLKKKIRSQDINEMS